METNSLAHHAPDLDPQTPPRDNFAAKPLGFPQWHRCLRPFLLLAVVLLLPAVAPASEPAILILHSYHQEYPWTKGQNDGFVRAMEQAPSLGAYSFYTEYLDTKRVAFSTEYQDFYSDYLAKKYQGFQPNLIYCSDDNALQFLIHYRARLFPGVPVVFSGINNLDRQKTLDPAHYVGVFEKKEIGPNISFITEAIPGTTTISFVGDDSTTYEAIKVEAEREMHNRFPLLRYAFFSEKRLSALLEQLKTVHTGVIFLTTIGGLYDEQGELIPLASAIEQIRRTVSLPIISMEDVYVRRGVLGGYVTSGQAQGKTAAAIAAKILSGTPPETIGSMLESPNIYMYQYGQLERFAIPLSRLPEGSIILERPQTFFSLYQKQILLTLVFVILQTAIIIFLIKNIGQRRQAEMELSRSHEELEIRVEERTTDLQQANARLAEEVRERTQAEQRLSTVVKNLPIVLWAIDQNGIFTLSTGKGLEKMDLAEGQMVGHSLFKLYAQNQTITDDVRKALAGESFSNVIEEGDLTFESHYSPLFMDNEIAGVIGIAIDVSERLALENKLHQAQKMEAIGTLAGGIAHDFNNILQGIMGYTELALADIQKEVTVRKSLEKIMGGALRARDLVYQILTFSRKKDRLRLAPMIPAPIIKESLKLLRASLPASIAITEDIDESCGLILADPTSLHQLIMNLCTNALHAMDNEEGVLTVTLQAKKLTAEDQEGETQITPGAYVEIMVKDTGTGMDEATMARIFEPFFTKKEVGKGTGLGLAVVHGIVRNLGGMIRVRSRPQEGSAFYVYFPIIDSDSAKETKKEDEALKLCPTGSERIMFVDDESNIVRLQTAALARLGYSVAGFTNSRNALEMFQKSPGAYDLVITDQTMPELTGKRLAAQLLAIRPDIPIILATGYSAVISEEEAKELGVKAFAMKPLDSSQLAHLVRQVLDQ